MPRLFAYGTLLDPMVQRALFGRAMPVEPDAVVGWRIDHVLIRNDAVIAASGVERHRILRRGDASDRVEGGVIDLTDAELAMADSYETGDYRRTELRLASGALAQVYVEAEDE